MMRYVQLVFSAPIQQGIGSSYKPSRKGHDRSIMNESNETCYKQLAAILSKENDAEY